MLYDIFLLVAGFVLLILGGNGLTDGAEAVARKFKLSSLTIGLTVVALGSSTPDLVVSLMSNLQDKPGLAMGNVVGANIFDILMAVGVMACIAPVVVTGNMHRNLLPLLVLASLSMFFVGDDTLLNGEAANIVTRTDGLLLLGFFAIYLMYVMSISHQQAEPSVTTSVTTSSTSMPMWRSVVYILVGLGCLALGGNWIVDGASAIARRMGMSQTVIGLTIVGIGNSLPDLFTSTIAALKRQNGIALGNLVGACIINIFLVIGLCATVKPMNIGEISIVDYLTLIGGSLLLWLIPALNRRHSIPRVAGILLCLLYVGYVVYAVMR